jgi:hypothetical protein
VAGSCEYVNETLGSMKGGEFVEKSKKRKNEEKLKTKIFMKKQTIHIYVLLTQTRNVGENAP